MRKVFDLIRLAAPSRSNILIYGESGTGKELVAKAIHHASRPARCIRDRQFRLAAAGAARVLALRPHEGRVHRRDRHEARPLRSRGRRLIFLDEIGNIHLETQAKLLRVIQEKEFMRLGSVDTIKVDVPHHRRHQRRPANADGEARFREDLYYRLNVITIQLPPLRAAAKDASRSSSSTSSSSTPRRTKATSSRCPRRCASCSTTTWPGNVRELENTIERAVVLSTGAAHPTSSTARLRPQTRRSDTPAGRLPPRASRSRTRSTTSSKRMIESRSSSRRRAETRGRAAARSSPRP